MWIYYHFLSQISAYAEKITQCRRKFLEMRRRMHYYVQGNVHNYACMSEHQEVIMAKIKVDVSRCKGCFLCTSVCPKGVLIPSDELGVKGFPIVHQDETKECIGCGACYKMCGDYCIEVID